MGTSLGEAVLRTRLDTRGLSQGLQHARRDVNSTFDDVDRRFIQTANRLGGLGNKLSLGLTAPILGVGVQLGKLASDAEEVGSKFEAVFKENTADAEAFAEALGRNIGRANTDLKSYLATLQDTFVPLGFARAEAAGLSKELVALSLDVASFNNATDKQVLEDFQSALVGNTETVRKYGVIITAANTEQEAYRLGIARVGEELTEQQKVQARVSLLLQGTTDAQGDALRTADGAANSYKAFRAALNDAGTEMGQRFLPVVTDVIQEATKLVRGFAELDEGTQNLIIRGALLAGALGPVLIALGKTVTLAGQLRTAYIALTAAQTANTAATALNAAGAKGACGPTRTPCW